MAPPQIDRRESFSLLIIISSDTIKNSIKSSKFTPFLSKKEFLILITQLKVGASMKYKVPPLIDSKLTTPGNVNRPSDFLLIKTATKL
jgi:hypothetical protein